MTLRTLGAYPGSQLHPGLVGVLEFFEIRLNELNGLIAAAEAKLAAFGNLDLDLGAIAAQLEAFIDVDFAATAELNALEGVATLAAALQGDIDYLATVTARLNASLGTLTAALNISEIHLWSYDGAGAALGSKVITATGNGFGDIGPDDDIRAAIFAGSVAANWATFSAAIYTGFGSGQTQSTDSLGLTGGTLRSLGSVPGGALLLAVAASAPQLSAEISAIADASARILANIAALLTLNFGIGFAAGAEAAAGATAGLAVALPSVDLALEAAADLALYLALKLALEPIVIDLRATINGGGIHVFSYSGKASLLGSELAQATRGGVAGGGPRDRVFALVLAMDNVAAFDTLATVLKVQ